MLGIASNYQKKGYGQDLLCDFSSTSKSFTSHYQSKVFTTDADPDAINFYARLGFVQLQEPPNAYGAVPMFLGIQHILAA